MALFRPADKSTRGLRALFHMSQSHASGSATATMVDPRRLSRMHGTLPDGPSSPAAGKLSELKPGESGVIERLHGDAQGRLRLMEMGLTPGAKVKVLHAAAFGGPLQISVRGYQLSLRREEASAVVLG